MLCVAALRLLVLQVATFALAEPAGNATALQPEIALPLSVNATVPVGAAPFTVAVNVTFEPTSDGLVELESDVLLETLLLLTTCDSALLVEPLLPVSPV